MAYFLILIVAVAAGLLSGVIGTGSSIVLLPLLVERFGAKQAVPIMAIAALIANIAKLIAWWRHIDWRAVAAYSITGVPAASLGATTLLLLPETVIDVSLGVFFLAMIPIGRWLRQHQLRITLWQLSLAGALIGFITGIALSTGPMSVPAFTSYGLAQGAFLSTEAAASLLIFITKVVTFQRLGALPAPAILDGITIGTAVMAGSLIGKQVVMRTSVTLFQHALEIVLLLSGLALIATAFRSF
jgi:uncharacterized membrane protein YfcA